MLFKKDVILKSNYPVEKLFERLEAAMVFDIKTPEKRKFRGKVDREKRAFTIQQPIIGNKKHSFRPEIKGLVKNSVENDTYVIELTLGFSSSNRALLIFVLIFYSILLCSSLMLIIFKSANSELYSWGVMGCTIFPAFTFLAFWVSLSFFKIKSSEAIDELSFIFGAREI